MATARNSSVSEVVRGKSKARTTRLSANTPRNRTETILAAVLSVVEGSCISPRTMAARTAAIKSG